ncbi:MAG: glycosyltransferase family 39 protein, partial [Pontimonas sp.]
MGDEWVYTMSSRHRDFWDQAPDSLGNHLFNLIYKSTWLCGEAFYQCGKILNLIFYVGFVAVLFLIALRFMSFWWALAIALATLVSPLSVYVSMFLPEPLYVFLLAMTLLWVLEAVQKDSWMNWALAGGTLALAALTKPHALISLVAIGIFIFIFSLGRPLFIRSVLVRGLSTLIAFVIVRVLGGFLLAGPIGVNFLTSYGAADAVGEIVGGQTSGDEALSPAETAFALFPAQFEIHVLTGVAALGAILAPLVVNVLRLIGKRNANDVQIFGLLSFVWFGVMLVAIVLFTGWVTGTGDDHTTR